MGPISPGNPGRSLALLRDPPRARCCCCCCCCCWWWYCALACPLPCFGLRRRGGDADEADAKSNVRRGAALPLPLPLPLFAAGEEEGDDGDAAPFPDGAAGRRACTCVTTTIAGTSRRMPPRPPASYMLTGAPFTLTCISDGLRCASVLLSVGNDGGEMAMWPRPVPRVRLGDAATAVVGEARGSGTSSSS